MKDLPNEQGPYLADRAGFKPATLRTEAAQLTAGPLSLGRGLLWLNLRALLLRAHPTGPMYLRPLGAFLLYISFHQFRRHLETSLFVGEDIDPGQAPPDFKWRYINVCLRPGASIPWWNEAGIFIIAILWGK